MLTSVPGYETARQVAPTKRLEGEIVLPGDKSISHRALMLALLAEGESRIAGAGDGADVRSTAAVIAALGATVDRAPGAGGNVDYDVVSPGRRRPACSGAQPRLRQLRDEPPAVCRHPRGPAVRGDPRRRRVAALAADGPDRRATAGDGRRDRGCRQSGHRAAARPRSTRARGRRLDDAGAIGTGQVGDPARRAARSGTTTVREAVATRDHTERMLRARGIAAVRAHSEQGGGERGRDRWRRGRAAAVDEHGPGRPVRGRLLARRRCDPSRRRAPPSRRRRQSDPAGARSTSCDGWARRSTRRRRPIDGAGEPIADLVVDPRTSRPSSSAAETAAAIDEIPILCLAATQARGGR